MRYLKLVTMLPLSFLLLTLLSLPVLAYTIDGNLDDWGVDLVKAYSGNNDGWIPNGHPNVDWIVENNRDTQYSASRDWTGYISTGYHAQKNINTNDIDQYPEPKIKDINGNDEVQPSGGEPYDIEALYFDDDAQNVYIAIVTSMSQSGYTEPASQWGRFIEAGDIAIDIDNSGTYEYGIKTHGNGVGNIFYKPTWSLPQENIGFPLNAPSTIVSGQLIGKASLSYVDAHADETVDYGPIDNYLPNGKQTFHNNIIEAKISRSILGNPSQGQTSNIHITMGCGNDVIELKPVKFKTQIPEFPSVALPVAAILGIVFIFGRRNKE